VNATSTRTLLAGTSGAFDVPDVAVTGIAYRSDEVRPGDAFFCISGFVHDGHDFASDAARRGASVLVVERDVQAEGVVVIRVPDTRSALALASAAFWGHPSRGIRVVGVTGTNGKTTTTYLIESMMRAAGHVTGLVGTVETRIADDRYETARTTPESADLQALFAQMRDAGVTAASMEVSSHAIDLHRVDGVRFAVAAFTNLTQDHLDYHHTIEEYFAVKRRLFTELDVQSRVVNTDDALGAAMAAELGEVLEVGLDGEAGVTARQVSLSAVGSDFELVTPDGSCAVHLPLAGAFNVSNALVAAGCAYVLGIDVHTMAEGIRSVPQVPGRLEKIDEGQSFGVYVDYAHTPDSLAKAADAVRSVTAGRVIVVFGCGGDRDPEKRPLMGQAAVAHADYVVLTSDNPRSEDPVGIILQIEDGARRGPAPFEVEVDRRKAISRALGRASEGDAVLIAGKGHEDYQIFADRTIRFDDREVAREELMALC